MDSKYVQSLVQYTLQSFMVKSFLKNCFTKLISFHLLSRPTTIVLINSFSISCNNTIIKRLICTACKERISSCQAPNFVKLTYFMWNPFAQLIEEIHCMINSSQFNGLFPNVTGDISSLVQVSGGPGCYSSSMHSLLL